jgi:hypothetical protein
MILRVVNLLLLVAALVGGLLALQAGRRRQLAQAEYLRLEQIAGNLTIEDPGKVYFRALPTAEPLHFAWRVYYPPNYKQTIVNKASGSSLSWSSEPIESILRVRFKYDEQGYLNVYTRFHGGSSRSSFGNPELNQFLKDKWDKLHVEQLGKNGLAVLEPDGSATLLRLSMPPAMAEEAVARLPEYARYQRVPVLYELTLGEKKAP